MAVSSLLVGFSLKKKNEINIASMSSIWPTARTGATELAENA